MALKLENTFNAIHASLCWWVGTNHSTSRQVNGTDAMVSTFIIMASAILFTRQKIFVGDNSNLCSWPGAVWQARLAACTVCLSSMFAHLNVHVIGGVATWCYFIFTLVYLKLYFLNYNYYLYFISLFIIVIDCS